MTIALGKSLGLPAEISGRRTAVFGLSGSGKSNTATVIVEGLIGAGEQVVLIDPKGEGWGLLSLANGKPSNLDVIVFGEPNGHIEALNETHGPKLADFVFETGQSVVLSLLGFESDQSERRFVASFLRHLYRRKTKQPKKTRTLVVFEEAHLFVPEGSSRGVHGEQAELSGAVQRIARQGRTFGLGSLFVDQRPQDVSKRVVSQVDTIICHQLTHKTDRDALSDWVKGYDTDGRGKTFLDSLASLQPGEAWIWSPSWLQIFHRLKVSRRRTYDSGAAPDDTSAAKIQRADIDLEKLRGQLSEIIERAKADDPKELRRRIAELQKQVDSKPALSHDPSAIERAVRQAIGRERQEHVTALNAQERIVKDLTGKIRKAKSQVDQLANLLDIKEEAMVLDITNGHRSHREMKIPIAKSSQTFENDTTLPRGEAAVLKALIQFPNGLHRNQLTVLTGYKRSSRDAYILRLKDRGFVETAHDIATATAGGIAALPNAAPLPTGDELRDYWLARLPEGERRVLEHLIAHHPNTVPRDRIDEITGYKRSSRDAYLQRLRARELIKESREGVAAADGLFD